MTEQQFQRFQLADIIEEVCVSTPNTPANSDGSSFYILYVITDAPQSSNHTSQDLLLSSSSLVQSFNSSQIARNFEYAEMIKSDLALNLSTLEKHMVESKEYSQEMVQMQRQITDLLLEAKEKDDKMLALQLDAKEKDDKMVLMQNRMIDLQNQTLDRLAILQKHAHAILVQNFELHEYPIPRLFIILPVDQSKWNPTKILENKFCLHFLCECGDHTMKASKNSQNQIHIAKHEGYEIRNGTEFFHKYGKYMLILMWALKMGMHSVNISVPHIPIPQLLDAGIDFSIKYMEALSVDYPALNNLNTIDDYEGLEGADLRQLGTFLQINDEDRKLGNLCRITTETGHVKWVCIDHYRSTYKEKEQKVFADTVEVNRGKYDSQLGKVIIALRSRIRAEEFFNALAKARHVYDLNITFGWDCSRTDLEAFEKALKNSILVKSLKTNVTLTTLELRGNQIGDEGALALSETLKTNTTLTTLDLESNRIQKEGALALSEALKTNTTLTTLNLQSNEIKNEGAQALSEAVKTYTTLTTLYLWDNKIGKEGALALATVSKTSRCIINY
ncbi:hypothetical protein BGX26_006576 [Mortierella sp. AD094]|nr:hypothetical protein BGX26_006576 [Mortierella sp. AD094]